MGKKVQFPSTDAQGEAKLKRLIESISLYMKAELEVATEIVLVIEVPEDRSDVVTVLQRIAAAQKKAIEGKL